jgi:hypothetical protein
MHIFTKDIGEVRGDDQEKMGRNEKLRETTRSYERLREETRGF